MTTTTTFTIPLTKNQILERLLKADHITFDEMVILMQNEITYSPQPWGINQPFGQPWSNPVTM